MQYQSKNHLHIKERQWIVLKWGRQKLFTLPHEFTKFFKKKKKSHMTLQFYLHHLQAHDLNSMMSDIKLMSLSHWTIGNAKSFVALMNGQHLISFTCLVSLLLIHDGPIFFMTVVLLKGNTHRLWMTFNKNHPKPVSSSNNRTANVSGYAAVLHVSQSRYATRLQISGHVATVLPEERQMWCMSRMTL